MHMLAQADWITSQDKNVHRCPLLIKDFPAQAGVRQATLTVTARGFYAFTLNGVCPMTHFLTPGCTTYETYTQYFTYDVTSLLQAENRLEIQLASGWYEGRILQRDIPSRPRESGVIAALELRYENGESQIIYTDETWKYGYGSLISSDIYDGAVFDATRETEIAGNAVKCANQSKEELCPNRGELVTEHERFKPLRVIRTPKGERVLDFGQNLAGFLEVTLTARKGERLAVSLGEILDREGNFYNENYRTARCDYRYTCKDGKQTFKPILTFYGFRYIRIDEFPDTDLDPEAFTAIALYSDMKRTGYVKTSDPALNRLFENVIWGQKGNFLDIPTDCHQRDERLGWTGDIAAFIRTAGYNFDVKKFMEKWLCDVKVTQCEDGRIRDVVPVAFVSTCGKAAWGDAVAIVPWQLYQTYGDSRILLDMLPAMIRWVEHIQSVSREEYLWVPIHYQYGDWLELNAVFGETKGETRDDVVCTAYYANTVDIIRKTQKLFGLDARQFDTLYENIAKTYKARFQHDLRTQSECAVTLQFGLCDDPQRVADQLAALVRANGGALDTGFLGTQAILRVLSQYGHSDVAYDLLLRREYPSWLYSVSRGATTIWEHWDGIKPDGTLWPVNMNSYNHYAYGCVADWMYNYAAGIRQLEDAPGFARIHFEPQITDRLDSFEASIQTVRGLVYAGWRWEAGKVKYRVITPSPATLRFGGRDYELTPGEYEFEK